MAPAPQRRGRSPLFVDDVRRGEVCVQISDGLVVYEPFTAQYVTVDCLVISYVASVLVKLSCLTEQYGAAQRVGQQPSAQAVRFPPVLSETPSVIIPFP